MRVLRLLFLVMFVATSAFAAKGTSRSSSSHPSQSKRSSKSTAKPKSTKAATRPKSDTVAVKSYKKKNGTVVQAHDRTAPNKTQKDNWSTKGNVNPETGKKGSKTPKK